MSSPWPQFLQEISTFSSMGSHMGLQGDSAAPRYPQWLEHTLTLSQLLLTQLPVLCPSWDKFCQRGPTWGWWAQLCPVKGLLELSGTALMPALGREPGLTQQIQELCPTQQFLTTLQQDLGPEHFVQLCLLQSFADLWESGSGVADTTKNGK